MCGQKLTATWMPSGDYRTGCYRVGCKDCGWAAYSGFLFRRLMRSLTIGNQEKRTKTNEKDY